MPDKYIKLEDAIYLIAKLSAWHGSEGAWIYQKDVLDKLETIPAADVAPVKHGRWLNGGDVLPYLICSECEEEMLGEDYSTKYCPFCGAKMDKKKDDA